MSDVFISYKAEDRRRVQPLVQALQADGYSVWWDEHIGTGDEWRQTIEHELDGAKCVVVIWSKRSIGPDGHFVRDEASRAQRRHVYVPVRIDAVDPPLGFGESQAASLRGWHGDRSDPHYQAVLSAVRRNAGERGGSSAPAARRPGVDRRAMIAGGAVAAVAVAGVGAWALLKPGAAEGSNSIAVLPFANLSGDPTQAYFSDGIAEELRNALARLAGLKVVGRTSSEAVRNDDAETAATKLGVATILTGSVRQSPSLIRVSAQLVDGRNGLEKWSNNYDRPPGDAIKIQTDIAESVARALSAALGGAARATMPSEAPRMRAHSNCCSRRKRQCAPATRVRFRTEFRWPMRRSRSIPNMRKPMLRRRSSPTGMQAPTRTTFPNSSSCAPKRWKRRRPRSGSLPIWGRGTGRSGKSTASI